MRTRTITLILCGYLAACAIMLAPITNFRHLSNACFGSDTRLNIWALAWVNHAVLDGAPIFDANIFFPSPNTLAYSEHLLGISVFTLPIYAVTRNPALAYNVVWLLSYLLCAGAAHALAWRVTRDHLASFVGGNAYAFCFYRMLHGHAHLQLLWAFWIPLSLLALERWWREPSWRRLAWLVTTVVMQVLASWYLAVMVLVADALLAIWLALWARPARHILPRMALQLAVGAALGAASVWPVARHYVFLVSRARSVEALDGSAGYGDYLIPPLNTLLGQWLAQHGSTAPQWIWGENTLFLGYVTLGLAGWGILPWRVGRYGDSHGRFWWGFLMLLGSVALALSLGPSRSAVLSRSFDWTPFGLFGSLPAMTLFRVPARFALLLTLALAVLAAGGAARLHVRFGRMGQAATLALLPLLLGEFYLVDFPGGAPQPEQVPLVYRQLAHLPARGVVSLPDYIGGPEWFNEPDYQYYSTAHWHPIVNGYSRTEPPGYRDRMAAIASFPAPASANALRVIGVDYVVLHAGRYGGAATRMLDAARGSQAFRLAWQSGSDYLFQVVEQ